MMHSNLSNPIEAIPQLKQEIDRLCQEQAEALKKATYVGMTLEEARVHDERRKKITQLSQQLLFLQTTKSSAGPGSVC
jgi:lipid II:glycine glycyltransferase (peptidoglycan interpeptide bridge formation enzyme)